MITTEQFIAKYEWKSLCNDYWCQCVKLAKVYSEEVLWVTLWYFWGSAKNWFKNWYDTFKSDFWFKEENTPEWIPSIWSLIFFEWDNFSVYWHVAVVIQADINSIQVLEQNWQSWNWSWNWEDSIRLHSYSYDQVSWWMIPFWAEVIPDEDPEAEFHVAIEEYSNWNIVVLYNGKYYINLKNNRVEVNKFNFEEKLDL